ncbi:hypothetical protein B0H17DRAFT_1135375 [Mycena rosella]|uniref:Alpha-type protein kinase domain-containing protein n=1 Tax=Mycena rosella TaxID=1033263 RepID=A0AAD7GCZ1_MYCRO|nr:hypothetical protein B0H17DRAFT_1135375 [Mycena rosella]
MCMRAIKLKTEHIVAAQECRRESNQDNTSAPSNLGPPTTLFTVILTFGVCTSYAYICPDTPPVYLVSKRGRNAVIDTDTEDFVKFIHNGDSVPLLNPDDPLYPIAEFLCFTQHVQYFKTDGTVFLSDLQGTGTWLTDPQIMASPYGFVLSPPLNFNVRYREIGNGAEMFGEGNVGRVFVQFPEQHICNAYCDWFHLPSLK